MIEKKAILEGIQEVEKEIKPQHRLTRVFCYIKLMQSMMRPAYLSKRKAKEAFV